MPPWGVPSLGAGAASAAGLRIGLFLGLAHLRHHGVADRGIGAAGAGIGLAISQRVPRVGAGIGLGRSVVGLASRLEHLGHEVRVQIIPAIVDAVES
ncbi:MAG: hypothetical protein CMP48_03160 [Rickettsiales bacterium]|nr:hypothetical protein [Rickettsiales bacterium]